MSLGRELKSHNALTDEIHAIGISADGVKVITAVGAKNLKVWNIVTGKDVCDIKADSIVNCVATSPDGRYAVAGSMDNCVRVWDMETTELVMTLRGHTDQVDALHVTHDLIFTGSSDHTMRSYDVVTGEPKGVFKGHSGAITAICASPMQTRISSLSPDIRPCSPLKGTQSKYVFKRIDTFMFRDMASTLYCCCHIL